MQARQTSGGRSKSGGARAFICKFFKIRLLYIFFAIMELQGKRAAALKKAALDALRRRRAAAEERLLVREAREAELRAQRDAARAERDACAAQLELAIRQNESLRRQLQVVVLAGAWLVRRAAGERARSALARGRREPSEPPRGP